MVFGRCQRATSFHTRHLIEFHDVSQRIKCKVFWVWVLVGKESRQRRFPLFILPPFFFWAGPTYQIRFFRRPQTTHLFPPFSLSRNCMTHGWRKGYGKVATAFSDPKTIITEIEISLFFSICNLNRKCRGSNAFSRSIYFFFAFFRHRMLVV